jgi:hypothetical protein
MTTGGGTNKCNAVVSAPNTKKSKGLFQPLHIPCRSPAPSESDNGGDRFSFGNVMSMMMMQNRMDSEQREQDYQLWHEEMAIMHEEWRAQRSMMTAMMMAMFQRNVGENSNPSNKPSPPSNNSADDN